MIESPKKELHLVGISSDFKFFYVFLSHSILMIAFIWIMIQTWSNKGSLSMI